MLVLQNDRIQVKFIKNGGHLGAMGAFLKNKDIKEENITTTSVWIWKSQGGGGGGGGWEGFKAPVTFLKDVYEIHGLAVKQGESWQVLSSRGPFTNII